MADIRHIAFEVVDKMRRASSGRDVYNELWNCRSIFGYDAFLIAGIPISSKQNLSDCKIISGWPSEWEHRYQAQRYIHVDPVIRHIKGASEPFLWREAANAADKTNGRIVIDEARAFGLNDGFCVPFHQSDGKDAGVSFGGERLSLSPNERAALHLIAIYAMAAAKTINLRQVEACRDTDSDAALTSREIECLKWSAVGKTAWEISIILSISRRTVEQYLTNAACKLNAVSRVHCVAEALRRGIIY